MSTLLTARELVMNRLVRRVRAFPELEIAPLATDELPARDQALAWAIDQAVSRRWLSLVALLEMHLTRPWERIEPGAKAALLAGAAQLVFMDRLPDYAVISEGVDWTKRRVRPKAGGLVNAVLRRVAEMMDSAAVELRPGAADELSRRELPLEDGRIVTFGRDVFAEESLERLAQQTSHGAELMEAWHASRDAALMRALAMHSVVVPPTLVTGVPAEARGMSPDSPSFEVGDPGETTERGEAVLTPHEMEGFYVFAGGHAELASLLATHPACRVQDPTSASALELAGALAPKLVIDMCAGRGTKTRQLAAMHPNARIVASDTSKQRVKVLGEVFSGSEQVAVEQAGGLDRFAGQADLVVCDVPCSNTGVLARRSEAKYRYSAAHQLELVKLQRSILNRAAELRAPGGAIVYATCSVEHDENAAQSAWASQRHGLEVTAERAALPAGLPGEAPSEYHDGGYAALLR